MAGAVVLTSAGGQCVTAADGKFELEVDLSSGTREIQVTAVASAGSQSRVASARVVSPAPWGTTTVERLVLASSMTCEPAWLPTFGAQPGVSDHVHSLAVFDDGGGPKLYAGGEFTDAGSSATIFIASWDGTSWSPVGGGIGGTVYALTVFDDGGGAALYAGGSFTSAGSITMEANNVAKWDGASWSALGSGLGGDFPEFPEVKALAVFDDGGGPALYAGGGFVSAGGVAAKHIARWDGAIWSVLELGLGNDVHALTVFDDGGGQALYAGGDFSTAGGLPASRIAKWDGTGWSPLGSGATQRVSALTVFDDGGGPALFAGGSFSSAGGVAANGIAKWDGTSWSALSSGTNGSVNALAVYDDGGGPALYAGGSFSSAGGAASRIAKWDGTSWSALGSGVGDSVNALAAYDDGSGEALYAGGNFTTAGGVAANRIAKWDGAAWSALGSGVSGGLFLFTYVPSVRALTVFDDGGGAALHSGGDFPISPAGDSFLAKWGCPPAIASVPGCADNPATLAALATSAPLGAPLPLLITGSAAASGVGLVYFGAPGFDGSGCGVVLPGLGELLLATAPTPIAIASGVLASGTCALAPTVPSFPALRGFKVHLQGAAVQLVAPVLIEPTNALAVTLGP